MRQGSLCVATRARGSNEAWREVQENILECVRTQGDGITLVYHKQLVRDVCVLPIVPSILVKYSSDTRRIPVERCLVCESNVGKT